METLTKLYVFNFPDVVIPTNSAEKSNIILKEGQKVMVLKSPKGIYMQLESGKIIAIRTAFKTGQNKTKTVIGGKPFQRPRLNSQSISDLTESNSNHCSPPGPSNPQRFKPVAMTTSRIRSSSNSMSNSKSVSPPSSNKSECEIINTNSAMSTELNREAGYSVGRPDMADNASVNSIDQATGIFNMGHDNLRIDSVSQGRDDSITAVHLQKPESMDISNLTNDKFIERNDSLFKNITHGDGFAEFGQHYIEKNSSRLSGSSSGSYALSSTETMAHKLPNARISTNFSNIFSDENHMHSEKHLNPTFSDNDKLLMGGENQVDERASQEPLDAYRNNLKQYRHKQISKGMPNCELKNDVCAINSPLKNLEESTAIIDENNSEYMHPYNQITKPPIQMGFPENDNAKSIPKAKAPKTPKARVKKPPAPKPEPIATKDKTKNQKIAINSKPGTFLCNKFLNRLNRY